MKPNFNKLLLLLSIFLVASSFMLNQATPVENKAESEICGKTIKYTASKLLGANGEEVTAPTAVTINPTTKIITVESTPPDQEKVLFETQIETIECSFNKKLTSGKAYYKGYILQEDGNKSPAELVLEAKDGVVSLTSYDEEKRVGLRTIFDKWEIIEK
ncbi:hypothetical protein [Pedobacter psychrodurus]|uniref:hypothetical protein n=1 Tax=Pedobacter psychrodurus TaxID=2530456 RepID=UPI00292CD1DD|nr:hypothetical protein [Pedobacter psychrodurus]